MKKLKRFISLLLAVTIVCCGMGVFPHADWNVITEASLELTNLTEAAMGIDGGGMPSSGNYFWEKDTADADIFRLTVSAVFDGEIQPGDARIYVHGFEQFAASSLTVGSISSDNETNAFDLAANDGESTACSDCLMLTNKNVVQGRVTIQLEYSVKPEDIDDTKLLPDTQFPMFCEVRARYSAGVGTQDYSCSTNESEDTYFQYHFYGYFGIVEEPTVEKVREDAITQYANRWVTLGETNVANANSNYIWARYKFKIGLQDSLNVLQPTLRINLPSSIIVYSAILDTESSQNMKGEVCELPYETEVYGSTGQRLYIDCDACRDQDKTNVYVYLVLGIPTSIGSAVSFPVQPVTKITDAVSGVVSYEETEVIDEYGDYITAPLKNIYCPSWGAGEFVTNTTNTNPIINQRPISYSSFPGYNAEASFNFFRGYTSDAASGGAYSSSSNVMKVTTLTPMLLEESASTNIPSTRPTTGSLQLTANEYYIKQVTIPEFVYDALGRKATNISYTIKLFDKDGNVRTISSQDNVARTFAFSEEDGYITAEIKYWRADHSPFYCVATNTDKTVVAPEIKYTFNKSVNADYKMLCLSANFDNGKTAESHLMNNLFKLEDTFIKYGLDSVSTKTTGQMVTEIIHGQIKTDSWANEEVENIHLDVLLPQLKSSCTPNDIISSVVLNGKVVDPANMTVTCELEKNSHYTIAHMDFAGSFPIKPFVNSLNINLKWEANCLATMDRIYDTVASIYVDGATIDDVVTPSADDGTWFEGLKFTSNDVIDLDNDENETEELCFASDLVQFAYSFINAQDLTILIKPENYADYVAAYTGNTAVDIIAGHNYSIKYTYTNYLEGCTELNMYTDLGVNALSDWHLGGAYNEVNCEQYTPVVSSDGSQTLSCGGTRQSQVKLTFSFDEPLEIGERVSAIISFTAPTSAVISTYNVTGFMTTAKAGLGEYVTTQCENNVYAKLSEGCSFSFTKIIESDSVNWTKGNPSFAVTLSIEGTDAASSNKIYYFNPTTSIKQREGTNYYEITYNWTGLPSGNYSVSEARSVRYNLPVWYNVVSNRGIADGTNALTVSTKINYGSVPVHNFVLNSSSPDTASKNIISYSSKKTTGDLSDTAFCINNFSRTTINK